MKLFLSTLFSIASVYACAQSLSSNDIVWTSSVLNETPSSTIRMNPGVIVTHHMATVEIKDQSGSVVKRYTLSNPVGSLADVSQTGSIRFKATAANGETGLFIIDRKSLKTELSFSFFGSGAIPKEYRYEISSFEAQ